MDPLIVRTGTEDMHLEIEPQPNSDRSWRFSLVFTFSDGGIVELGGWRVDPKFCEIMPPTYTMTKYNKTFLLGKMSPSIKMQLLPLLQTAIEQHKKNLEGKKNAKVRAII